jgi:protein phosphatase
MLTVATLSDPGAVRANNEDAVLWDPSIGLLAIADGMGGHNAGEVASGMAIQTLQRFLRDNAGDGAAQWPFGVDDKATPSANRVRTAMKLANRDVFRTSAERPECAGMGTTLTVALVEGRRVTFGSIGDSRLYSYSPSSAELRQQTRDDSLVGMLAGSPGVDPAILEGHPMKHLLTSVLGRRAEIDLEIRELTLADEELLFLCSDGMHGSVPDAVIRDLLASEADLPRAADRLIRLAVESGSRDNISVALARYSADKP